MSSEMAFRIMYEVVKLEEVYWLSVDRPLPVGTLVVPFNHVEWDCLEDTPITSVDYVAGESIATMYVIDDISDLSSCKDEFAMLMIAAGWTRVPI